MSLTRRVRRFAGWTRKVVLDWLYHGTISRWTWWPIEPVVPRRKNGRVPTPTPRVAYYIWHFPTLSETFVRREVQALRRRGVALTMLAEAAEDVDLLDDEGRAQLESTHYLRPIDQRLLASYKRMFRRAKPLGYANLYLYLMSRKYGLIKSRGGDRKLFESAVYLAGRLKEIGVDRVHSPWGDRCGLAAMLAAKLLDVPFSVQVRAHDLHDPNYHDALEEMLANAQFVITNTLYNRPFVEARMRQGGAEIHTIYNGIDLAEFDPPSRLPHTPIRLLSVARLIEPKGLTHLLDACALLRERKLSFECEVIGGPEFPLYASYLQRLMKKHRRLKLEEHVRFRGAQPFAEVMKGYRRSDIFVLPCVFARDGRRDITPNALIEAMAMKLPVVSTAMTGILEIVEHETSGLLVEPGDPVALADAIERLVHDRALARRLGEEARKRVESRFDLEVNVLGRVELFAASTNGHHNGAPAREASWQGS